MSDNETPQDLTATSSPPASGRGLRGGRPADAGAAPGGEREPTPGPSRKREGSEDAHDPERRCIISGERGSKAALIRLALSPDGVVAPDVRAKAPGRGAWVGVDRVALEAALAKGKLKAGLQRAFKTASVIVPDDLPARIEAALERAVLDRLGLEARSGTLLTGSDRIADAARKGTVALLLHARDAAADGSRKLDQALRVGLDAEGSDVRGLAIPAGRAILSMALGRENVVHIALIAPAAAARVTDVLGRWRSFIGRNGDAEPCDDGSQGSSASLNDVKGSGY